MVQWAKHRAGAGGRGFTAPDFVTKMLCDWASHFTSLVLSFFSCGMGILFNEHDFYMANTFIFSLNLRTVPCLYSRSSNTCLENERIKVGNKNVVYECLLLLIINSTTGCSRRLGLIVT